jgi:hypothetical protein
MALVQMAMPDQLGWRAELAAVIKEVVADLDAEAGEVILILHWMGGVHTELCLPRRRRGQRNSRNRWFESTSLLQRVSEPLVPRIPSGAPTAQHHRRDDRRPEDSQSVKVPGRHLTQLLPRLVRHD